MGRNITEMTNRGVAMLSAAVAAADVNGLAILLPFRKGRRIVFQVNTDATGLAAADIITVRVQARAKSDSSWHNLELANGSDPTVTPLAFDAQADAGELDASKFIIGELNLERLKTPAAIEALNTEMDALRLVAINAVAANVQIDAQFEIGWLFKNPPQDGQADTEQLLTKQIWDKTV